MYAAFGKIEADVIIVGAGISGLTAAHTILRLDPGLVVIILEANCKYKDESCKIFKTSC